MTVAEQIDQKLRQAFNPASLEVLDESYLHEGHAGARPGGQSHFRVTMISVAFEGKSRVQRQREVYQVLAEEMKAQIHALAMDLKSSTEMS